MSLLLDHPHTEVAKIIAFLKETFSHHKKESAVIAVSGGIDSALSLTLLTRAMTTSNIFPVLLPYGEQSIEDSKKICEFNQIPEENIRIVNIQKAVDEIFSSVAPMRFRDESSDFANVRKGNIMARVRMIYLYDLAKKVDGLVCGTENKSEKYLAYFTRFGDEASDIEPIQHLYKTQVRQLVEHLKMPEVFLTKAPSAGLWTDQTDEQELGFSYEQADLVMDQYIDQKKRIEEIKDIDQDIVKTVVARITSQQFKHQVPYILSGRL